MGEALHKLAFVRDVMSLAKIGAMSEKSDGWIHLSADAWDGLDAILGEILEELNGDKTDGEHAEDMRQALASPKRSQLRQARKEAERARKRK